MTEILSSAGSLFKFQQRSRLGQADTRNQWHHPGLPSGWQGAQAHGPSCTVFPGTWAGSWIRNGQQEPEPALTWEGAVWHNALLTRAPLQNCALVKAQSATITPHSKRPYNEYKPLSFLPEAGAQLFLMGWEPCYWTIYSYQCHANVQQYWAVTLRSMRVGLQEFPSRQLSHSPAIECKQRWPLSRESGEAHRARDAEKKLLSLS